MLSILVGGFDGCDDFVVGGELRRIGLHHIPILLDYTAPCFGVLWIIVADEVGEDIDLHLLLHLLVVVINWCCESNCTKNLNVMYERK